jgi:hypothetical protein
MGGSLRHETPTADLRNNQARQPGNNPQRKLRRLGDAGIAKYADPETRFNN